MELYGEISKQCCAVAEDFDIQRTTTESSTFTLPDGSQIEISGNARLSCPELLFNPQLDGK